MTSTVPAAWAGALTFSRSGDSTAKLVAAVAPKWTAETPTKPWPVTTTQLPPTGGAVVRAHAAHKGSLYHRGHGPGDSWGRCRPGLGRSARRGSGAPLVLPGAERAGPPRRAAPRGVPPPFAFDVP